MFGLGSFLIVSSRPSRLEAAAAAWAIGWAAVNLISFVANQYLAIPLDETFYVAVSLVLGVTGAAGLVYRRDVLRRLLGRPTFPAELKRGLGLGLFVLFAGLLVFILYKALIIFPVHPDELIYHMELPKVAWQTGFLPVHAGMDLVDQGTAYPNLLVTQQLWVYLGAAAFNPALVRPIPPIYAGLLVLLVFADTRRWFGLVTAGLAAATLLSLFSFSSLTILLLDEVPVAFYGYLAIHFAVETLDRGGSWYLAGLFAGFAALVKYDGLAALAALGLAMVLASHWRPRRDLADTTGPRWSDSAWRGVGFYAVAVPMALPLLIRNAALLENPIYPYFLGGLNAQLSPSLLARVDTRSVVIAILSSELVSLFATVLVAATLLGLARISKWSSSEKLLILVVVFYLPPYLAVPLLGSQIRYLAPILPAMAIFAGRQLAWWLWESPLARRLSGGVAFLGLVVFGAAMVTWAPFYSPYNQQVATMIVEVFAVSTGFILVLVAIASRRLSGRARAIVTGCMVLVLLAPGVIAIADEQSEANPLSWQPNLLPQTQDAYLAQRIGPDWSMWKWMNGNLPDNASVLSFEPRVFYLNARVVSAMSPSMLPTYNMTLVEAVSYVRSAGIGYVLDSPFGDSLFLAYLYVNTSPMFQNLANTTYFTVIHQEGSTVLYAIL